MSERSSALRVESQARHEAKRVLPHLKGSSRFLAPDKDDGFAVFARGRPIVTTAEPFVRSWLRSELIELSGNALANRATGGSAFVLTPIGEAFVVRVRAEDQSFAAQHRVLAKGAIEDEIAPEFNAAESPLGWLRLRRDSTGKPHISEAEFRAGERLRLDFTLAIMAPKVSASWPLERVDCTRRPSYSPTFESERALDARARFWAALDCVGQEIASVLIGVCCHLEGLEALERRLELPKRSGKTILRLGLKALARHYGLMGGNARAEIRSMIGGALPAE
ncbi:MAG TPA: DUF6456 domain-containing protein [Alphaproteobacteria bacterium]|nr:DUF6456 domain-containing protein [Alphaproteobacteria bacterium]